MQIQINIGPKIKGNEALVVHFIGVIVQTLCQLNDNITRLEVNLHEENSDTKSKVKDKRCLIEAQFEDAQPIAVSHIASSLDQAVTGAIDKQLRLIEKNRDKSD